MGRQRDLHLEADIVKWLRSVGYAKSAYLAERIGAHIESVRLSLSDLSYEKTVHRSRSGNYRISPGPPKEAGSLQVSPGSDPGNKAKTQPTETLVSGLTAD